MSWGKKKAVSFRFLRAVTELRLGPFGSGAGASSQNGAPRVYRVDNNQRHKPMTLDEAILEMEKERDYLVYRDVENDRLSVLMRRRDGHFDLVEC